MGLPRHAVMLRQLLEPDAQHQLGAAPRPAALQFHLLQPLQQPAHVEHDAGAIGREPAGHVVEHAARIEGEVGQVRALPQAPAAGPQGPAGEKGAAGADGAAGPQGPRGEAGPVVMIERRASVRANGRARVATVICAADACDVRGDRASVKIGPKTYRARVRAPKRVRSQRTANVVIVLSRQARRALARRGNGVSSLRLRVSTPAGASATRTIRTRLSQRRARNARSAKANRRAALIKRTRAIRRAAAIKRAAAARNAG